MARSCDSLKGFSKIVAVFTGGRKSVSEQRGHDYGDTLIMQPGDQVGGHVASLEMEIDEGYVWGALGEQALRFRRSRSRSDDIRSQGLKHTLNSLADTPGILHQEDIHPLQVVR